jgi:hypothetical protein
MRDVMADKMRWRTAAFGEASQLKIHEALEK